MRGRLTTVVCEIVGKRLGAIFLCSSSCRFDIHPQLIIVLYVKATAVKWVGAVGGAHDRVGRSDGGGPGIGTNLFVRDHPFDLDNGAVCRSVQEQVNPP